VSLGRSAGGWFGGAALFATAPVLALLQAVHPGPTSDRPGPPPVAARARFLMGARLSIETDGPVPPDTFDAAFDEVARLEDILSNWKRTSEVSRLNVGAARAPVRCSSDLFAAVDAALRWAEDTEGAFDPTVEPLVRDLGLRGDDGRLPGAEERMGEPEAGASRTGRAHPAARPPIGWRHVRLDPASRSVRFDTPGVGLDFGGIGKGIALDAAARVLRRHGVRRALLDFSGQVLAFGRREGSAGWPIGIADPDDRDNAIGVVTFDDLSVATSSNNERFVDTDRGRIGHILDPAEGRPARFQGSLTVAAQDATSADALSTALFVMGPVKGAAWAEARHIAALYLWRDASGSIQSRASSAFKKLGTWATQED
jgi:FAD:protein FMN transferase